MKAKPEFVKNNSLPAGVVEEPWPKLDLEKTGPVSLERREGGPVGDSFSFVSRSKEGCGGGYRIRWLVEKRWIA